VRIVLGQPVEGTEQLGMLALGKLLGGEAPIEVELDRGRGFAGAAGVEPPEVGVAPVDRVDAGHLSRPVRTSWWRCSGVASSTRKPDTV
jgi:hypothetical protein